MELPPDSVHNTDIDDETWLFFYNSDLNAPFCCLSSLLISTCSTGPGTPRDVFFEYKAPLGCVF